MKEADLLVDETEYVKIDELDALPTDEELDKIISEADKLFDDMRSAIPAPPPKKDIPTILACDDNGLALRTIKGLLQDDYNIILANSGKKLFFQLKKGLPDLILLDYEMPEMNGLQVLEQLKKDEKTSEVPVLFLTGVSDASRHARALSLNPAGYLIKPISKANLIDGINRVFEKTAAH